MPHRSHVFADATALGKEPVLGDDETQRELRGKAPIAHLPENVRNLFELMRWDHWRTEQGKETRFDRYAGTMQEYDGNLIFVYTY